jgi:hypothetical protein
MVLLRLGFSVLGMKSFAEYYIWLHVTLGVCLFVSVVLLVLSLFYRARFRDLLHIGLYPLGVLWIVSPAMFLIASVTVWGLHWSGYIPDFHLDTTRYADFEAIWHNEYFNCLAKENILFGTIYNQFQEVLPPIRYLQFPLFALSLFTWRFMAISFFACLDAHPYLRPEPRRLPNLTIILILSYGRRDNTVRLA